MKEPALDQSILDTSTSVKAGNILSKLVKMCQNASKYINLGFNLANLIPICFNLVSISLNWSKWDNIGHSIYQLRGWWCPPLICWLGSDP